jgi:hypothetical protein
MSDQDRDMARMLHENKNHLRNIYSIDNNCRNFGQKLTFVL